MKTFLSFIGTLVLGVAALWALVAFLQWDESDRENSVVQLLPYKLFYTHDSDTETYKDANGWYATLYNLSDENQWQECYQDSVSLEEYEHLITLQDQVAQGKTAYVIARVFNTKTTNSEQCEIAVGDWEKFLNMKQPSDAHVRKFNQIKKSEQAQSTADAAE